MDARIFSYELDTHDLDAYAIDRVFNARRELRRTPTDAELMALDLSDDDDMDDVPEAMTGNDAFRIIEIIKEREAARRAR